MGKFINTQYYDTVDTIVQMNTDLVQNPFYLFNDKKCTKVKYYNINNEKTTLDPASKLSYTDLGEESPIRYNVVHDLYIYQFPKVELNFDAGEFGMENQPVQGESYILPNTIVPCDGDYFEVDHIHDSTWLFKVTDVQRDTLDNGSNVWKIGWALDRTSHKEIVDNVVDEYKYINVVEGTNIKSVVKLTNYELATLLEQTSANLANYFTDLFWVDRVQTFIYKWYNEYSMYDPFAIEFIIRNRILAGTDNYFHVQHQCSIPKTFSIDYNHSMYRAFELKDKKKLLTSAYKSQADYIDDLVGIFKTRYEMYWKLNYKCVLAENSPLNPKEIIPIISQDLMDAIQNDDIDSVVCFERIIVKYFNDHDLTKDDLESLDCIDTSYDAKETYYTLLLCIFILDYYTQKLLS